MENNLNSNEFDEIMEMARRESARSGHYFIGVEHLFIALTKLKPGVTASSLEANGYTPRFVRYLLRQDLGRGDNRRFWPGYRETPRLRKVITLAEDMAARRDKLSPTQRDLFMAILEEGDNLPVRVLLGMDADPALLAKTASEWSTQMMSQLPGSTIQLRENVKLLQAGIDVLQEMFRGYERVEVERELEGGYTNAKILVARPYRVDGRADAAVVVKLDERQEILYEQMRYDTFVRDTLPPATSRIMGNPSVPDQAPGEVPMGGLKYTFVRNVQQETPIDLLEYARKHSHKALNGLLENLNEVFGEAWWSQSQMYRFPVWQEYEFMLPPAVIVEYAPQARAVQTLEPQGPWSRHARFVRGEVINFKGFTVRKVYRERGAIQIVTGGGPEAAHFSHKVEVRGIDTSDHIYYRGNQLNTVVGRVLYVRDDLLLQQAMDLKPPFNLADERLPAMSGVPRLPNPLLRYPNLLERRLDGSLSIIHGDLHLSNILVGPGGFAWLIDFAWTREGHTLFDWAVLEVSILTELVAPQISDSTDVHSWEDIWYVLRLLADMDSIGQGVTALEQSLTSIATIRRIVRGYLVRPDDMSEYYTALSLCAMRALSWSTVSLKARRFLFAVSALTMALAVQTNATSSTATDVYDITEWSAGPPTDTGSSSRSQDSEGG